MYTLEAKVKDLLLYTFRTTKPVSEGKEGYPKSALHTIGREMQQASVRMLKNVRAANDVNFIAEPEERLKLLRQVITDGGLMLTLIEISRELGYISAKRMEYWSKLVTEVRNMTASWRRKDAIRMKEMKEKQ